MPIDYHVEDAVAFVVLNRPERRNAVDRAMKQELADAWGRIAADDDVRAVVLAAAGDVAFSAGSDLREIAADGPVSTAVLAASLPGLVEPLGKPVVAALHGHVIGYGLTLAIHADLRIASEDARFSFPEVGHGSISAISAAALPLLVGEANALELLLTGAPISARRAHAIGLVNDVVAHRPREAAVALALRLAAHRPAAVRATKGLAVERRRAATLAALPEIDAARASLHPVLQV